MFLPEKGEILGENGENEEENGPGCLTVALFLHQLSNCGAYLIATVRCPVSLYLPSNVFHTTGRFSHPSGNKSPNWRRVQSLDIGNCSPKSKKYSPTTGQDIPGPP